MSQLITSIRSCALGCRHSFWIKYVPCHEDAWLNEGSSTILVLGTRWRWVVSFTPLPPYSHGNSPLYPLDRRLGGLQSRSVCCGERKNLPPDGNRTPADQSVARRYIDWPIRLRSCNHTEITLPAVIKWLSRSRYGMACLQVADGTSSPDGESRFEHTNCAVTDSWKLLTLYTRF
jgi:hypothetical protein